MAPFLEGAICSKSNYLRLAPEPCGCSPAAPQYECQYMCCGSAIQRCTPARSRLLLNSFRRPLDDDSNCDRRSVFLRVLTFDRGFMALFDSIEAHIFFNAFGFGLAIIQSY